MLETTYTRETDEDVVLLKEGWPHFGESDRVPAMKLWEQLFFMERKNIHRVYEFLCDLRTFEEYVGQLRKTRKDVVFWWYHHNGFTRVTEYNPRECDPYYRITMRFEKLEILIERIQPEPFDDEES